MLLTCNSVYWLYLLFVFCGQKSTNDLGIIMHIFKNCKYFIYPYHVYPYHRSDYSDTKFKFKNKRISGDDQITYKRKAFQSLWEGLRKVKAFHPNFIANQKNVSFLGQYGDRQITATFMLAITKLDRKISTASFILLLTELDDLMT